MTLNPHLSFDGQCRAAFELYASCLGGRIVAMLSYGESPLASEVPPDMRDKIMHVTMEIGACRLSGADVPPAQYEPPRGVSVLLSPESPEEAERVFGSLAEGGSVHLPLQKTFWAARFGMVTDRFGTPWLISC